MNRHEREFDTQGEAKLRYLPGEFRVLKGGSFVICTVTGQRIVLSDLKYWSVDLQEAYATPEAALQRHRETVAPD